MPPGAFNCSRRLTVAGCPPPISPVSKGFITPPSADGGSAGVGASLGLRSFKWNLKKGSRITAYFMNNCARGHPITGKKNWFLDVISGMPKMRATVLPFLSIREIREIRVLPPALTPVGRQFHGNSLSVFTAEGNPVHALNRRIAS
jgi:hypothetical protein